MRVWLSVRLNAPEVVNLPSVPIPFDCLSATSLPAEPVRVAAVMPPPLWVILPAEAVSASAPVVCTHPPSVRSPLVVASVTAPPLTLPPKLAPVPAVALKSVPAVRTPEVWLIAPAAFRVSAPVDAVRLPLRLRSPLLAVVRAMLLADTVSETVRVWLSVRLNRPLVTVNCPSAPIRLTPVSLTSPPAEPVRLAAVRTPELCVIAPAAFSDSVPDVAVRFPFSARSPWVVLRVTSLADTGPVTVRVFVS